jgi:hypothetical protein
MTVFVSRTVGDVISEILMSRTAFGGSFLVVEGDDDIRFWKPRAAPRSICQFVLAGSKPTAVNAVIGAGGLKQTGILGVIDDDCDSLLGRTVPSVNVIRTETRDLETLLLSTQALERILGELGDAAKIYALEQREGRSIRDAFVSRALVFGQLRYLSTAQNWNVSFDGLSPWRFANVASWTFDEVALLHEYAKQVTSATIPDIEAHLRSIAVGDPWSILHGKDTLNVLAVGVRSCIGSQQHPIERLLQMLRLAFDGALFHATQLYASVKKWESLNAPYRIVTA